MSDLLPFLGRFHVLVLHVPVGLLGFALLQEFWFALRPASSRPILANGIWLAGLLSAILACILGYLLAASGDYDSAAVAPHLWWGLAATGIALAGWLCFAPFKRRGLGWAFLLGGAQAFTLGVAGHHGGSLTHGPDFLTEKAPHLVRRALKLPAMAAATVPPPPASTASANLFADYVHPILERNCVNCHRPGKTKGGLRLDTHAQILLGGESGLAVVPHQPAGSELLRRVTLPKDDEDFMPGGGKKPLSSDEIAILRWWIETGAAPNSQIADLKPDPAVSAALARVQGLLAAPLPTVAAAAPVPSLSAEVPQLPPIQPASATVLARLESLGFDVKRLSQDIAYLDIDYYPLNRQPIPAAALQMLREIGDHVVWLNLAGAGVTDEQLGILGTLPNLTRLDLTGNPVTTTGLAKLPAFSRLVSLNLTRTGIDDHIWAFLDRQPRLQHAYLWGTKTTPPGRRTYLP